MSGGRAGEAGQRNGRGSVHLSMLCRHAGHAAHAPAVRCHHSLQWTAVQRSALSSSTARWALVCRTPGQSQHTNDAPACVHGSCGWLPGWWCVHLVAESSHLSGMAHCSAPAACSDHIAVDRLSAPAYLQAVHPGPHAHRRNGHSLGIELHGPPEHSNLQGAARRRGR